MDIVAYNREAWNRQSVSGCRWSQPVTTEETAAARRGDWRVILTPNKPVPQEWFGDLGGARILCLASGGGQQAPILSAAGARVTSFDNSDEQLAKDRLVAERDGLRIDTLQGNMADLSALGDQEFDLIFHPVSNVFAEDIRPVWRECARVLKREGRLLSGFMNPMFFLFDHEEVERTGVAEAVYALPYSDLTSRPEAKREAMIREGLAYEFGHTLEDQIGGQLAAGFTIHGFYEDDWEDDASPLNRFGTLFIATYAVKT